MLKIEVARHGATCTLTLDGKLAGPWVDELERLWTNRGQDWHGQAVTLDLSGVTYVDCAGKRLLGWLYEEGVALRAYDVLNKAMIQEIQAKRGKAREASSWLSNGAGSSETK